jgi:hypothetical protein
MGVAAGRGKGYTVPLFWLTYHHPDGPGVVVIESTGLLHARLNASLARADRGLAFVSRKLPNTRLPRPVPSAEPP